MQMDLLPSLPTAAKFRLQASSPDLAFADASPFSFHQFSTRVSQKTGL